MRDVPGERDLADIEVEAPEGFVPQTVEADPDPADVTDLDVEADS